MVGESIGHYEVLEQLGAGAMGEVYRALDTNLKRNVAIKVLPEELVEDADRLARLQREAQLLAAMNHPNVASIYSLEQAVGKRFLVLELIEGESLDDLIANRLPVDDVLRLCGQIAEALEAAHRAGIIHRDLKPANIMVTPERRAKVLDFGIAKAVDGGGGLDTANLTELTGTGMIVGTAPYMSPEQVRDQPLDSRTDIWAFGCVLYEMLAGKRAFGRETVGDTLCAILEHEPDWSALPTNTPLAVDSLLRRCLQKDPQLRLRDIGDAWVEINGVLTSSPGRRSTLANTDGFGGRARIKRRGSRGATIALLAAGAAVVFGALRAIGPAQPRPTPAPTHRQITFTGDATDAAISPDGTAIVYVTGKRGKAQRLMLADVGGGPAVEILVGRSVLNPEWSPDGSMLTVAAQRDQPAPVRVYLVRRLGGDPRHVGKGLHSTWSPDGTDIAYALQAPPGFWVFSESTGEADFAALDGYDFNHGLSWSPGGDRLAVLTEITATGEFEILTVDRNGADRRTVVALTDRLSSPRWAPNGEALYFLRHAGSLGEVLRVDISSTGDPMGEPVVVLSGLQPGDNFNLSADGGALTYSTSLRTSNLWLAELPGDGSDKAPSLRQLTTGTSLIEWPSFSPDGQWIAYAAETGTGANVFRIPAGGGDPVQLTFSDDYQTSPVWSPDGGSLAFTASDDDGASVWMMGADGTQPRRLPGTRPSTDEMRVAWAPGRLPLYELSGNQNMSLLDVGTNEERSLVADQDRGFVFSPQYSPDGSQVAVYWNRLPRAAIWLVTLEPYSERVLTDTALDPIGWSADGTWVYAVRIRDDYVARVPATGGDVEVLFRLPGDVSRGSVDSTGTRIVVPVGVVQSDVFLVQNFDPK